MRSRAFIRRLAAVAALTVGAGLLAACGESSSEGQVPKSGDGPVEGTLTFYNVQPTGNEGKWWDDFIADFEKKYPGTEIEQTIFSTQEYWAKTLAAFSSGDEPDLFVPLAGEDLNKYVRAGKIAPLDELVDLSVYNPAAVEPFELDGHVNAVPISSYIVMGWANDDLLAEYGLETPSTWEDLLGMCETLSSEGIAPFAIGNAGQDRFPTSFLMDVFLYQLAGSAAPLNATYEKDGLSWTDERMVEAASRLRELIDSNCFPDGFTGLSYPQMTNMFAQGKAAVIYNGSWLAATVGGADTNFSYSVFPWVDVPDANYSTANLEGVIGGVSGLGASMKSAESNPALVAAFLNEFGAHADEYANAASLLSVAAEPQMAGGKIQTDMAEILASAESVAPVGNVVLPKSIADAYESSIVALTTGELTPEAWAEGMADTVDRERANLPDLD